MVNIGLKAVAQLPATLGRPNNTHKCLNRHDSNCFDSGLDMVDMLFGGVVLLQQIGPEQMSFLELELLVAFMALIWKGEE